MTGTMERPPKDAVDHYELALRERRALLGMIEPLTADIHGVDTERILSEAEFPVDDVLL